MNKAWLNKFVDPLFDFFGSVQWDKLAARIYGRPWTLEYKDHIQIASHYATNDYYVALTHRSTHLTTYLIGIAQLIKTGKFGYWRHALMNCEGDVQAFQKVMTSKFLQDNFKFIESTAVGVHYSTFFEVFNVDGVCLLKLPRELSSAIDEKMFTSRIGKPYDNLFDVFDDTAESCVELVWQILMDTGLKDKFPTLWKAVQAEKNLLPEMFYQAGLAGDFEIVFEVRKKFKRKKNV